MFRPTLAQLTFCLQSAHVLMIAAGSTRHVRHSSVWSGRVGVYQVVHKLLEPAYLWSYLKCMGCSNFLKLCL